MKVILIIKKENLCRSDFRMTKYLKLSANIRTVKFKERK